MLTFSVAGKAHIRLMSATSKKVGQPAVRFDRAPAVVGGGGAYYSNSDIEYEIS